MKQTLPDEFTMRGPIPPEPFLPRQEMPVWGWFAISGAICLIALLCVRLGQRKKHARVPTPDEIRKAAYQTALRELHPAFPDERSQDIAKRVSLAVRGYLAAASGDPALYETHEESLSRHEFLNRYPDELRIATRRCLERLAQLKYGRESHDDARTLPEETKVLLDQLHATPVTA
jgi:hypothetical protein